MAKRRNKIDILIDTSQAVTSIKDMKESIKDLKNAASKIGDETSADFIKISNAAGEVRKRIDDINSSIKAQSGDPIEKVAGSFGNLGSKLSALDFKGASGALQAFTGNLKAIPFKEMIGEAAAFGSEMLALGAELLLNPIFLIAATLAAIGVALYKVADDARKSVDKQIQAYDDLEKKVDTLYDRQIKQQEALGLKTEELQKKKLKDEELITNAQIKLLEKLQASWIGLNDEQTKKLAELHDKKLQAYSDEIVASNKQIKDAQDATEKNIKAAQDSKDKMAASLKKANEDNAAEYKKDSDAKAAELKKQEAEDQKYRDAKADAENAEIDKQEARVVKQKKALRNAEIESDKQALADASIMLDEELKRVKDNLDAKRNLELTEAGKNTLKKLELQRQYLTEDHDKAVAAAKEKGKDTQVIDDQFNAAMIDNSKKTTEEIVKEISSAFSSLASSTQQLLSSISDYNKEKADQRVKDNDDSLNAQVASLEAARDREVSKEGLTADQKTAINDKYAKQEYDLKLKEYTANTAIKKKAFEQDKKLRIAQAVISTITGAIAALTGMISAIPGPVGIVLGVVAGLAVTAAGVLQIAKINAQKFDAGSPPTPPSISGGGGGADQTNAQFNPTTFGQNSGAAGLNTGGLTSGSATKPQPQKVYVTQTDIADQNNKVNVLQDRATIG